MTDAVFTPAADRDVFGISRHLQRKAGLTVARQVLLHLFKQCEFYRTFPKLGESCEHISPGLRLFLVHKWIIYFTEFDNTILIHRIIHSSRRHEEMMLDYFQH